jgi:hypothetical protein
MADTDSVIDRIRQEAERALLTNAIFRWESAVVIGGAVLLSVFFSEWLPGWPVWAWPVVGLVAEAAVIVSSLTDKSEMQKVMETLFREKYSTAGLRDRELRAKLDEAEEYRRRIQEVVAQQKSGILRDRLVATTSQVYDWIANMVMLARRLDTYRADSIIRRDQVAVPKEITELEARLARERNAQVREQIAATLDSKRQFAASLQELAGRMERADLQLDHSLAALGTVYSQLLLVSSKDVDSDRADRLRDDIRGEVLALQDLVESLNEVYGNAAEPLLTARPTAARRRPAPGSSTPPGWSSSPASSTRTTTCTRRCSAPCATCRTRRCSNGSRRCIRAGPGSTSRRSAPARRSVSASCCSPAAPPPPTTSTSSRAAGRTRSSTRRWRRPASSASASTPRAAR